MKRVCLVIVTRNRLEMLKKCVAAAAKNASEADVLVVDNASTDGTGEWLRTQPQISVLHLPENVGGAGGFAAGMKWAHDRGYEWLWIMDDDVVPLEGGLDALLSHGRTFPCVQPTKLDASGRIFEFEGIVNTKSLRRSRIVHEKAFASADHVPCNATCFEGLFISRKAIDEVGLPNAEFFMGWDDIYYGMRLARRFPLVYVREACVQKQFDKERIVACGRRWFSSSPASRARHLRNMRRVIALERLGMRAWMQYYLEWCKAKLLDVLGVCGR